MDIWSYVRVLRAHWWIVLVAATVGLATGAGLALATTPQYASTVTFFVNTPSDTIAGSATGDTFGQKRVNTYVQLITTDRSTSRVAAILDDGTTAADLTRHITAKGDLNTVLLTTTVLDPSPQRSLDIATAISTEFVELVAEMEAGGETGAPAVRLEVVDGPTLNPQPVEPAPLRNMIIGGVLGLLAGIGLALLRNATDKAVRDVAAVEQLTGAPVIGTIYADNEAASAPVLLAGQMQSLRAEGYRQLRTNLQFIDAAEPARTVVVTSALPDEGKSSTSTNLAVVLAEAGRRVLLIEADLRRPRVASYLGLEGSVGLTTVITHDIPLMEAVQPSRENLSVLASGATPPNPAELLGGERMAALLAEARERFDVVVIDSPPLLAVTDAAVLATVADAVILVVRHGSTPAPAAAQAVKALATVGGRLVGCVVTRVPAKGVDGYRYGAVYYDSTTTPDPVAPDARPAPAAAGAPTGTPPRRRAPRHADDTVRDAADTTDQSLIRAE
ncbi:polysaccharide biosynthesis tyrosine autokinase [Nakamurella deserti]|uniref:polysaccharide biosynthesis tyrosine autokinase n=1 Tax=Nakamurella deserti TaxID=2164074 RepID=UPI000DBE79EB|nr:polysaccharide biosynthesis tyrosine autokinase [Nakamurella deserti]